MTADLSIFDMTLGEIPDQRVLPEGPTKFRITNYEFEKVGEKQTDVAKLELLPLEPLAGQDWTDMNPKANKVEHPIWLTAKSATIAKEQLKAIAPELSDNTPMRAAFETLLGREVSGNVVISMVGKNKDIKKPEIKGSLKAA